MLKNKMREQMSKAFLDALSQGRIPWRACWSTSRPYNGASGRKYQGSNATYLSFVADEKGYADPRWATYKQAQDKGWQVRRGEKGILVEYWAYYDKEKKKLLNWGEAKPLLDTEYGEKNLSLRCYISTVFNVQQMDGVPPLQQQQTDIGALRSKRDLLVANMAVSYQEKGSRAYYSPGADVITLPPESSFDDTYSYMCTFLHEAGHATGHWSRLNRDLTGLKGGESYAREELRAEIASAFTAQAIGLQLTESQLAHHMDQHKAYIQAWTVALQDAPNELYAAIRDAEKIADYLLEKGEFEMAPEPMELTFEASIDTSALADRWGKPGQTDDVPPITEQQLRMLQSIGRKSINAFSEEETAATNFLATRYWTELGAKSPFFRAWFGDWRAFERTPVRIAEQIGNNRGTQKNEDTGWLINVSRKVFSETQSHSDSPNKAAVEYLKYIEDIVRKAILLDSIAIPAEKAKSHNSLVMHSLYAVADAGHGRDVIKLYVEEMFDPNSPDTSKRAYQLQNIEKYRHRQMSSQKTASSISVDGNIVTIADLVAVVKQRDRNFRPWTVDPLQLLENGYPKPVYLNAYMKGDGSANMVSRPENESIVHDRASVVQHEAVENKSAYESLVQGMTEEEIESLQWSWDNSDSMDDEEYQEWYEGLTNQQQMLVDAWDKQYSRGVQELATTILEQGQARNLETSPMEFHYARNLVLGGLTLHITGPMLMPDYDGELQRPWQDRSNEISHIVVEEGVNRVGSRAFYRLPELQKISLASSVKELGYMAMDDCPRLQTVEYLGDSAAWEQVKKGWNYLPPQFTQEAWEQRWGQELAAHRYNRKESYLPVGARLDADGREGTVSSDFTPDALIRTGSNGRTAAVVAPAFRTETLDFSEIPRQEIELEI